jgi:geranylgeranyl diphosphate synthase type II
VNLKSYLQEKRSLVDAALTEYLPPVDRYPEVIYQAMRYSVFNGGKRLRPVLAIAGCEAVGGNPVCVMPTACAIECIHAFSLIHDDLPALDDDDLRRGKPTNHKVFGEATAILAGDALLAFAFELMTGQTKDVPAEVVLDITRRVASASGTGGMVVGQVVDMICEGQLVEPEILEFMHRNKTGALIEISIRSGAMLGGGTPAQVEALSRYGWKIGLAFQIADDILDIVGDVEKLGKPIGSDAENQKSTYPALFGLDRSRELAQQTVDEAVDALCIFGERADPLRAIARYIVDRDS